MTGPRLDPRSTPATERVALDSLRGLVERPDYTAGRPARVVRPVVDLRRQPNGPRDRQILFGTDVIVIETRDGWSFVQSDADGYCGWLLDETLATDQPWITHRVRAAQTVIYPEPSFKVDEIGALSLNSLVTVTEHHGRFMRLASGGWVPEQHLSEDPDRDPADVAGLLIGTPYVWGGNSRWGIDCSGMVQAAALACGIACPGDSDQQCDFFPEVNDNWRRGDLLFWPGHVAMVTGPDTMIHANAHAMAVTYERISQAVERIEASGDGALIGARRLMPD